VIAGQWKKNQKGSVWLDLSGAVIFFLFLILGTFILLFIPEVFEIIYGQMGFQEINEIHADRITHKLWDQSDFKELPSIGRLMYEKEIVHFQDIRTIIRRMIIGFWSTLSLLVSFSYFFNWKRLVLCSAALLILVCVSCGLWSWINWLHMFETLHNWLFQNDSWKLPNGCITLRLFPYKVWEIMGGVVLVVLIIAHAISFFLSWAIPKSFRTLKKQKATN